MLIHPSADIHPSANIGEHVQIGAYSIIGENVQIGKNSIISPHVIIQGPTTIGESNQIFPFATIGSNAQDLKFKGEVAVLEIGDHNIFREYCSVNRGTGHDRSMTSIGSHNTFLAYTHIAHDCDIKNHVIMSNNATLAGHVQVGNYAVFGGFSAVHQFGHIGAHAMIGAYSWCNKDVPAYIMVINDDGTTRPACINKEGLKRRGFSKTEIITLDECYKFIYRRGMKLDQALEQIQTLETPENQTVISTFIDSIKQSKRGVIR